MKKLQFIHIGKCGGSTVTELLQKSPLINQKYSDIIVSHVCGVQVDSSCDFLICLRNPISRVNSAFSWRNKLVVLDSLPNQVNRFHGEHAVLSSYGCLDRIGSLLYDEDGSLNQVVARDFDSIHHLRESISFYLDPLLDTLAQKNVFGVICQEDLAKDCEMVLGISPQNTFIRKNDCKESVENLSEKCVANLKKYLYRDYSCILRLWSSGILSDRQVKSLLFGFA